MITQQPFGQLPDGRAVMAYTIDDGRGLSLTAINYGGIVTQLHVPDRNGQTADVTLGYDTLEPYLKNPNFFGCLVGRTAGRTTNGTLTLDGKRYELELNGAPHHVHGGSGGLHTRFWDIEAVGPNALRLTYISPNGECGYPGEVNFAVTYTLKQAGEWQINYEAATDQPTPLNLTHHAYFNLAGHDAGSVLDHDVRIFANEFVPTDETSGLSARRKGIAGLPNNFRQSRRLGEVIDKLWLKHGDLYLLPDLKGPLRPAANISHAASGRTMAVWTTEPMLQFYAGVNMAPNTIGKGGAAYPKHAALCLEAENYPDGVNHPEMGDIILRPGQTYRQTTVYRFSPSP